MITQVTDNGKNIHFSVEDNVQITIDEKSFVSVSIEQVTIEIGKHASVTYTCAPLTIASSRKIIFLISEHAQCTVVIQEEYADLGIATYHREIVFNLQAPYAQATCTAYYYGQKNAALSLHIKQLHTAPQTKSAVMIKSVVDDTATFSYQGFIAISQNTQHVEAQQYNKNILLSNYARVHTKPVLEVQAHDVSCAHGSVVSYIHEEHLFYCASRGMSLEQAKEMIVNGFLSDF